MDIHEIHVYEEFDDPRARKVDRQAAAQGIEISVQTNRVFYIEGVSDEEAVRLAEELLSDSVTQRVEVGPKQVIIEPLKLIFASTSLALRK